MNPDRIEQFDGIIDKYESHVSSNKYWEFVKANKSVILNIFGLFLNILTIIIISTVVTTRLNEMNGSMDVYSKQWLTIIKQIPEVNNDVIELNTNLLLIKDSILLVMGSIQAANISTYNMITSTVNNINEINSTVGMLSAQVNSATDLINALNTINRTEVNNFNSGLVGYNDMNLLIQTLSNISVMGSSLPSFADIKQNFTKLMLWEPTYGYYFWNNCSRYKLYDGIMYCYIQLKAGGRSLEYYNNGDELIRITADFGYYSINLKFHKMCPNQIMITSINGVDLPDLVAVLIENSPFGPYSSTTRIDYTRDGSNIDTLINLSCYVYNCTSNEYCNWLV